MLRCRSGSDGEKKWADRRYLKEYVRWQRSRQPPAKLKARVTRRPREHSFCSVEAQEQQVAVGSRVCSAPTLESSRAAGRGKLETLPTSMNFVAGLSKGELKPSTKPGVHWRQAFHRTCFNWMCQQNATAVWPSSLIWPAGG